MLIFQVEKSLISGLDISLSHSLHEFDSEDVDSTALSISLKF